MNPEEIFKLFPECLISAIRDKRITELTEIQRKGIPHVMRGEDVLLIAPTGSGKTEAAIWPIISRILAENERMGFLLLYITPLRALNRDLEDRIIFWASRCGLNVGVRHGDTLKSERLKQSESPPEIIITTPETLQIMLSSPKLSLHLSRVRYVVIDEVHELLDDKRGVQLSIALERLRRMTGRDFQRVMLSASLGNPHLALDFFSHSKKGKIVTSGEERKMIIRVIFPKVTEEDLKLSSKLLLEPEAVSRVRVLADAIKSSRSAIVFTNTRSMAEALGYRMNKIFNELKIHVHHSSLSREARVESETLLKMGELSAVISTSSMELGIDVGHIDMVIQYGSPKQALKLLQRVGRSGHGPRGVARGLIVAQDSDDFLESLVLSRNALEGKLEEIRPLEKSYDVLYHTIVGMLLRERELSVSEIVKVANGCYPYRDMSPEDCRRLLSFMSRAWPRIVWYDEDLDSVRRASELAFDYFFNNVSTIPETVGYSVVDEVTGFYIGKLDEAFVLEYLFPGAKFVFRGSVWRMKRIEGGTIYVEQAFDPIGAIPSWIGEQLPVSMEVAAEVGTLRGMVEEAYRSGKMDALINEIMEKYGFSTEEDIRRALSPILEHIESGFPLPTDKRIVVEDVRGGVVIHSTYGNLVNRTLGRAIAQALLKHFKILVRVSEDPYRILILGVSSEPIINAIKSLMSEDEAFFLEAIENSSFFRLRLLHTLKRMGLIRDYASSKLISLSKLAKAYEGTPPYEEALRETLVKDFDVEGLMKLLRSIERGEIEVVRSEKEGPSPLALLGLDRSGLPLEVIPPTELSRRLLENFKNRILSQQVTLVCSNCWSWFMDSDVNSLMEIGAPLCPNCGSGRIAAVTGYLVSEAKRYVEESRQKGRPSVGNWELANRCYEFGLLTERYGLSALVAMVARAVDPIDVEKLLSEVNEVNERFFEALAKVETEAVKRRMMGRKKRSKL
jgi:ATP-dependent Lhr-like helicase